MNDMVSAEAAAIRSAKSLICSKRFEDALLMLESISHRQLSTFDPVDQSMYFLLYGRCLYELGLYRSAILKARVAAHLASKSGKDALYAEVKCQIGRIRLSLVNILPLQRNSRSLMYSTEEFGISHQCSFR